MEEYNPKVVHIKGVNNDAADALSGLDITDKANNARVWREKSKRLKKYVNVHMMNCSYRSLNLDCGNVLLNVCGNFFSPY